MNIQHQHVLAALNDFAARELGVKKVRRVAKIKRHPLPPKLARIRAIQREKNCSLSEALKAYETELLASGT